MTTRARVCHGVPPPWPALAATGPLLASPGWLRAMRGRLGDETMTVVVDDDGVPSAAAFASVQAAPRPGEFFDLHHVLISDAPGLPLTAASRAARAALVPAAPDPPQWTPNLVVMLPGYECVPVGPAAGDPTTLAALVDGAVDWAAAAGMRAVAFLYTRPEARVLGDVLAGRGFVAMPLSISWDLPVPPGGVPDYLASLSRKRRVEVARELATLADRGVRLHALDPAAVATEPVLGTLTGLRCQLVRKYRGAADERAERRRLGSLVHDVAGGRAHVLAAVAGGKMVGFALFAEHREAWHCLAVGYDYSDPRSRLAYFGTAFYAAVPAAAAAGIRWLGYGQGSADAKRSRGCVGTRLTGWVRAFDPRLATAAQASAAVSELVR